MIPKNAIQLCSGKYVDLTDPSSAEFTIEDIAHSLARIGRFTGHCHTFYSVAQHSVLVSRLVPHPVALTALLHDASEAFLGDVASPLKALLPEYRILENMWAKEIAKRFGTQYPLPPIVHAADKTALVTEKNELMPGNDIWDGFEDAIICPIDIEPMDEYGAEQEFLDRYRDILNLQEPAI